MADKPFAVAWARIGTDLLGFLERVHEVMKQQALQTAGVCL